MKALHHKKNLLYILACALGLTILGFILDLHERVPNVWVNIFEILVMTVLIFAVFAVSYFLFVFFLRIFSASA